MRLLVFLLLIAIVAVIIVRLVKGATASPPSAGDDRPRAANPQLVRCASCGAFVPRADALPSPDGFRCSDPACRANA